MRNNAGEGETFSTLKIGSKIKTFHTINEANGCTAHKRMIMSDTAQQAASCAQEHHGHCGARSEAWPV